MVSLSREQSGQCVVVCVDLRWWCTYTKTLLYGIQYEVVSMALTRFTVCCPRLRGKVPLVNEFTSLTMHISIEFFEVLV